MKHQPIIPAIPLTDPRFVYRSAPATDVQAAWRRFGWVPPSQLKPQ